MGLYQAAPVIAVNNKDKSLGVLEVVAPKWPDLVLHKSYQ